MTQNDPHAQSSTPIFQRGGDHNAVGDAKILDRLQTIHRKYPDVGVCWVVIQGRVITCERPKRLTPRGIQALLLDIPSRSEAGLEPSEEPTEVELQFFGRSAVIFEHGSDICLVELPLGSKSRKSLRRCILSVFRLINEIRSGTGLQTADLKKPSPKRSRSSRSEPAPVAQGGT